MKLWHEDPAFPDWASVFDIAIWDNFRDRLVEVARLDGYELKFTFLRGVDHLRLGSYVFHALNTDEMITSDKTRKAEFVTENGLVILGAYASPWAVWEDKESSSEGRTTADVEEGSVVLILPFDQRLTHDRKEAAPFYFCRVNATQDLVIFIPKQEKEGADVQADLSSTRVRNLMKGGGIDPQNITGEATDFVLGPQRRDGSIDAVPPVDC